LEFAAILEQLRELGPRWQAREEMSQEFSITVPQGPIEHW
jgi:hypothetical protein